MNGKPPFFKTNTNNPNLLLNYIIFFNNHSKFFFIFKITRYQHFLYAVFNGANRNKKSVCNAYNGFVLQKSVNNLAVNIVPHSKQFFKLKCG